MIYHKIIIPFLIALQFLTKIPVRLPYFPTAQQNALSVLFYPVIGLFIGAILWGIAMSLSLPLMLKTIIILSLWIWLTGGLHLDGLADTADGFVGGYGDKERTLAIMKDPNTGAMGVIAIVVLCLFKFSLIYSVLEFNKNIIILLFAPILGRVSILVLFSCTAYVRQNGLGASLSQYLPKKWVYIVVLLSIASTLLLTWSVAIHVILWSTLAIIYLRSWFIKRIGGITGDTLGASVEIIETLSLGVMLIALTGF